MSNVLTRNIWNCDSLGIIYPKPVLVKAIAFHPAAVSNTFTLKWWNEDSTTLRARNITYSIAESTDDTVTATTSVFPSTWLDGNVVKCLYTSGSDGGKYGLIQTAGNDTAFVTWGAPFTVEALKVGNWDCYPTYTAFTGLQPTAANTHSTMWFHFDAPGFVFPNLALDFLSTSSSLIIYVG
jgi:hypothetical protein